LANPTYNDPVAIDIGDSIPIQAYAWLFKSMDFFALGLSGRQDIFDCHLGECRMKERVLMVGTN